MGTLLCVLAHKLWLWRRYGLLWCCRQHWCSVRPLLEVWAAKFPLYCILQTSAAAKNNLLLGTTLSKGNFRGLCWCPVWVYWESPAFTGCWDHLTVWVSNKTEHSISPAVAAVLVRTHAFPTELPAGLWMLGSARTDSGLLITSMEKTVCKSLDLFSMV